MNRPTSKAGGFSLIEVLLVVLMLGIICVTLISVFAYGYNLLAKTTQTNLATQVAQYEIERYRNMRVAEIPLLAGARASFTDLFGSDETSPYFFLFKKDGTDYVPLLRNGRETIVIAEAGNNSDDEVSLKKMTVIIEWDYHSRTIAGGNPMRKDFVTYLFAGGIDRR